uniref:Uncharacterized protein n=1 Tax=Helianthus annuus TaxID=4232 RepID=A0A251RWY2_HELAN
MIGSVSSVRVCRDRFSHKSLGYGYRVLDASSGSQASLSRPLLLVPLRFLMLNLQNSKSIDQVCMHRN